MYKLSNVHADIGRICLSLCGRDKGKYFIITRIEDEHYVYIADGVLRKIDKPKRKKLKHLELKSEMLESISEKLKTDKKIFDAELRSALINTGHVKKY